MPSAPTCLCRRGPAELPARRRPGWGRRAAGLLGVRRCRRQARAGATERHNVRSRQTTPAPDPRRLSRASVLSGWLCLSGANAPYSLAASPFA